MAGLKLLKAPATKCSSCGDTDCFTQLYAEGLPPYLDMSGDPICDECWQEENEFTCIRCQEYGDVKDQHRFLVVVEQSGDVRPGIYSVVRKPYYVSYILGGHLYDWALSRIMDAGDWDAEGYDCGHLCLECQETLGLALVTKRAA